MGVRAQDIFGGGSVAPAIEGSYGEAPQGYRLPADTHLGGVRLQIADLERSLAFYQGVLGLRVLERDAARAVLTANGDDRVLVELHARAGARPVGRAQRLGLYHFAILLPDRASLGRFVKHLAAVGVPAGAGDHLVSEAFYISDPDGLGIEIYADRPRGTWQRRGRELMMATDPVDVDDVARAAGDTTWAGMPAGTVMGHVHLHVGDLAQARAFFSEGLGFDRTVWSYPGALFLGAGGYHHHLGTNTWAGSHAPVPREDDARLLEWTIVLPDAGSVKQAGRSLADAGYPVDVEEGDELTTTDPWGTRIRLRA